MKKIILLLTGMFLLIGLLIISIIIIKGNKSNFTKIYTNDIDTNNIEYESVSYSSSSNITLEDGKDVSIKEEGVYTLTGTSSDSSVIIETDGEVTLILDNVDITNKDGSVIYVINAKKFNLVLKEGTTNKLTDSSSYSGYGEEDVDAVIYSKDELIISGTGTLYITANYNHGIHSKDYIQILEGTINIICANDGIIGKDYIAIKDGNITINSKSDGLKTSNLEDASLGYIQIDGGNITINSDGDAINAVTTLTINDGLFDISSGGGAGTLSIKQGGAPWEGNNAKVDDGSYKGLKAGTNLIIKDGTFKISSKDDAIHSNGNITINGGDYNISSSDDGLHADGMLNITGGNLTIFSSEGLEATYVKIDEGTINISASDDGINAGNKSNAYSVLVEINGGNTTIKMGQGDTDGIDSNGDIVINGGTVNITGQSCADYDGKGVINGGTVICNGSQVSTLPNQMMGGPGGMMMR